MKNDRCKDCSMYLASRDASVMTRIPHPAFIDNGCLYVGDSSESIAFEKGECPQFHHSRPPHTLCKGCGHFDLKYHSCDMDIPVPFGNDPCLPYFPRPDCGTCFHVQDCAQLEKAEDCGHYAPQDLLDEDHDEWEEDVDCTIEGIVHRRVEQYLFDLYGMTEIAVANKEPLCTLLTGIVLDLKDKGVFENE